MRNGDKNKPDKELTLVTQKAAPHSEKYVIYYESLAVVMHLLEIDQQFFLINLMPSPPQIPNAMEVQCDEGGSRLALLLAIAEYHMAGPRFIISVLA